jgi:catechol 2,3-dioxygenase-like lactoylglutathione lyase family enzyme
MAIVRDYQGRTPSAAGGAEFDGAFVSSSAQKSMVEAQPLIAVRNVRASSRWYSDLLGADALPDHPHRDVYDRIWRSGRLLLQLHAWDAEEHPNLVNADAAPLGHGVVLWFQVDNFDAAVERARRLKAEIIEEPHVNPAPQHREIWLRDPDGYVVVVASPDGERGA